MGKIFGYVYTFLSIFLAIPVLLILLTWNTTPGQLLYPVKRALEEAPRFILKLNPKLAATYEVKITDRRFEEASKLIAYSNTLGLKELNKSLIESKTTVLGSSNAAAKKELKSNLLIYKQKLAAQKIELQQNSPPVNPQVNQPSGPQQPAPSQPTNQAPPTPAQTREATTQITETETIIEEIITEINNDPGPSTMSPSSASAVDTSSSTPSGTKVLRRTLLKTTTTTTTNPDGTVTVNVSTSSSVIDETPIK